MTFAIAIVIGLLLGTWVAWTLYCAKEGERYILESLSAVAPDGLTGLDLVEISGGVLRRGTVYVLLARLEERGLIKSTKLDDASNRRVYWLSASPSTRSVKE